MTPTNHSHSPPLPRRSKGKYTSQACKGCAKRKLKCSGHRPCQRCLRNGEECIFAEGHRRSTPSTRGMFSPPNLTQACLSPRVTERLDRLEARLDALASSRDGGAPRASAEPDQEGGNDFQGEIAFQDPINVLNANIEPIRAQLGLSEGPSTTPSPSKSRGPYTNSSTPAVHPASGSIRVGSRTLPFPSRPEYDRYLSFFFDDINPCHSCVNQAEFRQRSTKLFCQRGVGRDEICFLALNYIIFSCADVLKTRSINEQGRLPGWQWFLIADDLVAKRTVNGQGDLSLVQFLVYNAFYLVHADKPNAAYNVIGLACRLCFQFGLHQQRLWGDNCDGFTLHMRQRLCWTVYFVDRRIALSCGRPYGIRDSDIQLSLPDWLNDLDVKPMAPLPAPDPDQSSVSYLCCMVAFAKLAGEVWDQVFAAGMPEPSAEIVVVLDARIQHWVETVLPGMQLLPSKSQSTQRHQRQHCLVVTRFNHLRLLLRRRAMVSLTYDASTGRLCGKLAMSIVEQISLHRHEISDSSSFRFHMAASLGGAILVLATLLCRDLSSLGLESQHESYAERFTAGVGMLDELSVNLSAAKRIADDLNAIVQVVSSILSTPHPASRGWAPSPIPDDVDTLFPYGSLDFAQQHEIMDVPHSATSQADSHVMNSDAFVNLDAWDFESEYNGTGYGVPWI